jgi:hypothetical protein
MMHAAALDPTRAHRHRYIVEDPARFACLLGAAALFLMPEVPFALTLLVVAATQLGPVLMAARALDPGWSNRWGSKVHPSVFASSLSLDFATLAASTVVGALLLVRHFNGAEVVRPLSVLAVALCLLPDVRLCRWILASDPVEASRHLRHGWFFQDPVLLTASLSAGVVCVLDSGTLTFVMLSLALFGLPGVLVIVDKYLPEIEARGSGFRLLDREARRLWIALAPLALVPARVSMGDRAAGWGAAAIGAAILLPDGARLAAMLGRGVMNLFRVTPVAPATYVMLPK